MGDVVITANVAEPLLSGGGSVDIICSLPLNIRFTIISWNRYYTGNIFNFTGIYWHINSSRYDFQIITPYDVTLNDQNTSKDVRAQMVGTGTGERNRAFDIGSQHRYLTYNKLSRIYALPQPTYQIEGLDTKVNFSVQVKQYINPIPNTYNLGDIASDSNNNYWIVARDNTGSSVWKSINIRDLYSSSLVYNLGDLIVNPDDSIDVMYRTDNNIWKRIGTLKI